MALESNKNRDWDSASPAARLAAAPVSDSRRTRRLVWKEFLDLGVEFKQGEGYMKREWVFGVAVDACACT